ncbi:MAG: trimethylguanosine synthase [Planctomycetes bacterium]|jgi:trimethylguanosine synthase|nr:trimethylguanosine synthase [Planctomycetota bacterium]
MVTTTVCPFGPELQEFWEMRHDLFSRFDEGIRIDAAGLFGVKPEELALRTAARVRGRTVLDALCGVGGTVIAFARTGKLVTTCDIDPDRLAMARENARIYGVENRITFLVDDIREVMGRVEADAVYLDPPWGGKSAAERDRFGLDDYRLDGRDLLRRAFAITPQVILSMPPNFVLSDLVPFGRDFSVEQAIRNGDLLYLNAHFA